MASQAPYWLGPKKTHDGRVLEAWSCGSDSRMLKREDFWGSGKTVYRVPMQWRGLRTQHLVGNGRKYDEKEANAYRLGAHFPTAQSKEHTSRKETCVSMDPPLANN
ncbi:hypothetical protein C8J57DRAFT_1222129 [Mycena rebaudengoi]|nr:hypothetical protein C8J57DRAFT_1222129 [Mycena rebaudengoi]